MQKTLTDSEFAVTIDCLSIVREQIREKTVGDGLTATPNIDSAYAKLTEGITPATSGLRFELIQPEEEENADGDQSPGLRGPMFDPPEHLENPDNYRGPDGVLGNDFVDKGY